MVKRIFAVRFIFLQHFAGIRGVMYKGGERMEEMTEEKIKMDDPAEKVIRYYAGMVYRIAFARSGSRHDAEEIFQEVFLRYVKKRPHFEEEEHRKAWLIRVTVNCAAKMRRSLKRQRTEPLDGNLVFETSEKIELYEELQKLPVKYRDVIHLFYYEDMSVEEISKLLNRKNSTVRAQLTRARSMMRKFMKEEDYV